MRVTGRCIIVVVESFLGHFLTRHTSAFDVKCIVKFLMSPSRWASDLHKHREPCDYEPGK